MEKQSTEQKGLRVSKMPDTSVTDISKIHIGVKHSLSTPAQNVSFCFNLFMNELQLQPLSQDGNTPRTGRELSKESNQTEGQKRASIKANHGLFYNPPSLSCTSNHLTFTCKSDPFIAELINCIISYNYTYIKYKRSPHLQIHFQKVK